MAPSTHYRDPSAAPSVSEPTREKAITHITTSDALRRVPASRRFPSYATYMTASQRTRGEADHLLAAARLQWFHGLAKAQEDHIWACEQRLQDAYYDTFERFFAMERAGTGMVHERLLVELPPVYDQTLFKAVACIIEAEKDGKLPYSRRYPPMSAAAAGADEVPHEREAQGHLVMARERWNEGLDFAGEQRYWVEKERFQERYLELFGGFFLLMRADDAFLEEALGI